MIYCFTIQNVFVWIINRFFSCYEFIGLNCSCGIITPWGNWISFHGSFDPDNPGISSPCSVPGDSARGVLYLEDDCESSMLRFKGVVSRTMGEYASVSPLIVPPISPLITSSRRANNSFLFLSRPVFYTIFFQFYSPHIRVFVFSTI